MGLSGIVIERGMEEFRVRPRLARATSRARAKARAIQHLRFKSLAPRAIPFILTWAVFPKLPKE